MQTRCPDCQTLFYVTDAQLKAAGGRVQCGRCFAVFEALEHSPEPIGPERYETDAVVYSSDSPAEADWAPPASAPRSESAPRKPPDFAAFSQRQRATTSTQPSPQAPTATPGEPAEPDQAGADSAPEADQAKQAPALGESSKTTEEINQWWVMDSESARLDAPEPSLPPDEARHTPEPGPSETGMHEATHEAGAELEAERLAEQVSADQPVTPAARSRDESVPLVIQQIYEDQAHAQRRRRNNWVYGSAAALLVVIFIAQSVWVFRDHLARNLNFHPVVASACQIMGCELQPPKIISALRFLESEVSEATQPNALRIFAKFVNESDIKLAYPVVRVTLSDQRGNPVAMRYFTPDEYLPIALQSSSHEFDGLSPDVPLEFELQLVKPEEAVFAYEFDFF